jgi:hypothetical protein
MADIPHFKNIPVYIYIYIYHYTVHQYTLVYWYRHALPICVALNPGCIPLDVQKSKPGEAIR